MPGFYGAERCVFTGVSDFAGLPGLDNVRTDRPERTGWAAYSADAGHGGAEEGLEVGGGLGVTGEGGVDGFLGGGAGIAEVDEGREGVFGGRSQGLTRGVLGGGCGKVVEFVFELEDDTLGGFFADAGNFGEGGVVGGPDRVNETGPIDTGENSDGQFGSDAGDREELFEEAFFLRLGEAVEGELVFGDAGVDMEGCFHAFAREGGEGGNGDRHVVADASAVDDGLIRMLG